MKPYFNTSGSCSPGEHYMLPPERRLGRIMELIEQGRYFTLHAGRQTGKTTCARWLVQHYRQGGQYVVLWVDIQAAREQPDLGKAFRTILTIFEMILSWPNGELKPQGPEVVETLLKDPSTALSRYLNELCGQTSQPVVLLFDEADGLVGEAMISFLTQLRFGYLSRNDSPFPHSVGLVGMRQVRDYVLSAENRQAVSWLGTTSPFNITAESQTLTPFSCAEVEELLLQHTAATGQRFEAEAVALVCELSQGHPWLVNALADQTVRDVRDLATPITRAHVESAKDTLILERRTHIDSLMARLHEPRIKRIIEPMLLGERLAMDVLDDDLQYVNGLGLIRLHQGLWEIANPIYREVIPRTLTFVAQTTLAEKTARYLTPDGQLDLQKLLMAFQKFWRKDGHLAAEGFAYREAGPHLMLMAFLQCIVNGGGRVEREYGLGRGALDLLIEWKGTRHVIEVKLRRDTDTEQEAIEQVSRYLDHLGLQEGWLVLFDLRKEIGWDQKLTLRNAPLGGKRIRIVGC